MLQKILTHSKSRVVLQTMKEAAASNKIFQVYVTQSAPDYSGYDISFVSTLGLFSHPLINEINVTVSKFASTKTNNILLFLPFIF